MPSPPLEADVARESEEAAQTRRAARTAHYGYDPSRVYSEA